MKEKMLTSTPEHNLNEANTFAGPSPAFFKVCKLTLYSQYARVCGCLCVCVYVRACLCGCMHAYVLASMHVCVWA